MRALAIAATGMDAQQTNLEVIANNIANINTTAFKRARAEFTDLLYQAERMQGVPLRGGENPVPEGAQIGLGVRTAAIRNLHLQGALAQTGNRLDLALERARLVPGDRRRRRDALHARRRLQHQCERRARHARRLSGRAGDHGADRRRRRHRQRIRPGLCAHRAGRRSAASRPAEPRDLRQRRRP